MSFARGAGVDVKDAVSRLKSAGADSVPGAADLLVERIRKSLCPNKCSVEEWVEVMRALAENSMTSSATMTFGMGETFAERVEHLDVVRRTQDETGVFKAFIAWPVSPERTLIEERSSAQVRRIFENARALSRVSRQYRLRSVGLAYRGLESRGSCAAIRRKRRRRSSDGRDGCPRDWHRQPRNRRKYA